MQDAESHSYLDDDQHCGCNGSNAIDIVLGKSFTMDTVHFQCANIRCTDCDAKACYDWILPVVLLLVYVKSGQGSTDSPPGWTSNADMFIDDNTLLHNDKSFDISPTELLKRLQHDAETRTTTYYTRGRTPA
eukprot:13377765-Ditylum_brightwellii.AAC.1